MKKTAPKKTSKKVTPKKTAPRSRTRASSEPVTFTFRRIIIVGGLAVLLMAVMLVPGKSSMTQSVAGISIARPLFSKATINWGSIEGAVSYNIYYKRVSDKEFNYAVRNLPADSNSYTIYHLKKGEEYLYKISAVDESGKEFLWSDTKEVNDVQPM